MFAAGSTSVREVSVVKVSMVSAAASEELARIGDPAAHRTRCGGERAREQRARAAPLAAFEIAVARAHAVLPARHHVAVHAEAHRAARFPPLGSGGEKDAIEA